MPTAAQKLIYEAKRDGDVGTLIAALTDPENRAWAARYLGDMGDPQAIGPLIRLLSVKDFFARAVAAKALGRLRAVEAVSALVACIDRGPGDIIMRAWAIDALGKIGSDQAVPRLIEVLGSPEDRSLWRTAAVALGGIGDARAVQAIEQAAKQGPWIGRRHYRRAIRRLRLSTSCSSSNCTSRSRNRQRRS